MLKIYQVHQTGQVENVIDQINRTKEYIQNIKELKRVQALKLSQTILIDETTGVCILNDVPDTLKMNITTMLIQYYRQKLDSVFIRKSKQCE